MTQILEVVANGLRRVGVARHNEAERRIIHSYNKEQEALADAERREWIRRGVWHDGRLDCVAGNGVISELGVGIERFGEDDEEPKYQERYDDVDKGMTRTSKLYDRARRGGFGNEKDVEDLPVVVIKNFGADAKSGKVEVVTALAEWASDLVSNRVGSYFCLNEDIILIVAPSVQIAHVIVISDNRDNAKRLAKGGYVVHSLILMLTLVNSIAYKAS